MKKSSPKKQKPTPSEKIALREQIFTVYPTDLMALQLFASKDETRKHLTGVNLDENYMTACDGFKVIQVDYFYMKNESDDTVVDYQPKNFFKSVTLCSDFVFLLTEAAKLTDQQDQLVEIRVFEKINPGDLDIPQVWASALNIERLCLEGDYPQTKKYFPKKPMELTPRNPVDGRFYMDAIKAVYLVMHQKTIPSKESHYLALREEINGDKVGYYNSGERVRLIISPIGMEKPKKEVVEDPTDSMDFPPEEGEK